MSSFKLEIDKEIQGVSNKIISVIVPVYMVESYLPTCIDSIINQTYPSLDIILIDDGSLDNCGTICDQYAKKDKRIRVFHLENCGLSGARNYGIQKAMENKSDYVAFVDSDDWIESTMFEMLLKKENETGADVVECNVFEEYSDTTRIHKTISEPMSGTPALEALLDSQITNAVWNKLWSSNLFSTIRFPEGRVFEEIATTYKLIENAKVNGVDKALYHYVQRRNSISHSHDIKNLRDYWLAHYERYLLCVDKVSNVYKRKLLYFCAIAISRAWCWQMESSKAERIRYAHDFASMNTFVKEHFPLFGVAGWPLSLRLGIFLSRFNNTLSFSFAYIINQLHRLMRKKNLL